MKERSLMDDKSLRQILANAAREATNVAQCSGEGCYAKVRAVLNRRILPMLEAGQVLANEHDGDEQGGGCPCMNGANWIAAKKQAMEG